MKAGNSRSATIRHQLTQPLSRLSESATFFAKLDPALVSAAFVGLAGLSGVIIGVFFVHWRFNRKLILYVSAFGTAVAFTALGLYFRFQPSESNGKTCLFCEHGKNIRSSVLSFCAFPPKVAFFVFTSSSGTHFSVRRERKATRDLMVNKECTLSIKVYTLVKIEFG